MNSKLLDEILQSVTYPGYTWCIEALGERGWLVWASFMAPCSVHGGEPIKWTTRKWYISKHACRSEVIGSLFKLVLTSLEHEARELFKVDGQAVYDPHVSIDALAAVCHMHEVRT